MGSVLQEEARAGLNSGAGYLPLSDQIRQTKRDFLSHLIQSKAQGKSIVAYGAPAKGSTLLNYAGVRDDFIDYAVDRSPRKQGRYLPGTQILVLAPEHIDQTRPDLVLILAWNLANEIESQMSRVRQWGGQFMTVIPKVRIW